MEDTLSNFMSESAKRHEENSNSIKEIQAMTDASIRNQGASIKTLEIQIKQMSKSISTTIEADSYSIRRIGSSQYAISTGHYKSRQMTVHFPSHLDNHYCEEEEGNYGPKFMEAYGASHINNTIPRKEKDLGNFIILDKPGDIKVPLILEKPFLFTARAKIDVYKRKITLRVWEEKIIFKSVKPASSIIKRVYMLSLRERIELDLEARLIGETLVLNRSLDPFLEDYIKLNDLNESFELRRNQGDDLMPTIETFSVMIDFAVLEDMDAYRDE
ncbi:hypothetical protein Tco_1164298 [Tanacetum coccineum]